MKRIKFNSSKFIILFFVAFIVVGAANVLMSDGEMNTSEYVLSEKQKNVVSRSETQPKIPVGALVNSELADGKITLTAKIKYEGKDWTEISVVEDVLLDYQISDQKTDEVLIPYTSPVPSVEKKVSQDEIIEGESQTTEQLNPGVYQVEVEVPIVIDDQKEIFLFRIPVEIRP
ncbi:hypothetical protein ABFG93_04070 [Pseudalkalibacillus hwajinpoensis]|uniref:hypothetical protein n=1 Tax=Guptibacillus hwajinpoensis TaxID=208199 RepID=UPI00325BE265